MHFLDFCDDLVVLYIGGNNGQSLLFPRRSTFLFLFLLVLFVFLVLHSLHLFQVELLLSTHNNQLLKLKSDLKFLRLFQGQETTLSATYLDVIKRKEILEEWGYFPMTFLAAISMSSDFMVFLPACIAKSSASLAILIPTSSSAFASSFAAASLTLSAPAFLHSLCIGATANSKSTIKNPL